jgi:hypothetical protein
MIFLLENSSSPQNCIRTYYVNLSLKWDSKNVRENDVLGCAEEEAVIWSLLVRQNPVTLALLHAEKYLISFIMIGSHSSNNQFHAMLLFPNQFTF